MKHYHIVGMLLALGFLVAIAALTKTQPGAWNDISRVATIEALVEHSTWTIDNSPWVDLTKDKISINGKFYSDKMPLLSFLGAGLYAIIHYGFGMTLALDCSLIGSSRAYYWLTFALVGVPVVLMLWLFFDFARRQNAPLWVAVTGTIVLGIGTMIFPYSLVFNNNMPSACLVFAAFYVLVTRVENNRRWLVLAGLLASLAISFDLLSGIMAMGLACIALARYRTKFIFFVLGALIPLGLTAWLDYQIAGTIIPPYMITGGYVYPGSALNQTVAGIVASGDQVAYAFRMFLGSNGLFAYNPLLCFALTGGIIVTLNRKHPLWIEGASTLFGFVLLSLYLVTNTDNYGGLAYGERWFIVSIPTLFAFIFFVPPLKGTDWKNAGWILFVPMLGISVFSTLQGAQEPWIYWPPPLQSVDQGDPEIYYALARVKPIEQPLAIQYGSHLSLVGYTIIPTSTLQGGQTIHTIMYWRTEKADSQCYQMRAQVEDERGHVWAQEVRDLENGSLPTNRWVQNDVVADQYTFQLPYTIPAGNYVLKISVYDLQSNEMLIAYGSKGRTIGEVPIIATLPIEKNKSSITAGELQKQNQLEQPYFVDMVDMRLIGFKPISKTVKQGELLSVGLYWRARNKPSGDYSVFVQLRNPEGVVILEQKNRPASGLYPTTEWNAGEVLLDWHDLIVPDSIESGAYALWVGLYNANGRMLGEIQLPSIAVVKE